MKLGDAIAIKVGSANQSRVYVGSTLVWPANYYYHIVPSSVVVHYSAGTQIYASGSNYAYITGDVQVRRGQVVIQTIEDAVLTPYFSSSSYFYLSGTEIHAYSRGVYEGSRRSLSVSVTYSTSEAVTGLTVYQEANVETEGTPIVVRHYGTPQSSTVSNNYLVSIGATAYTTQGGAAPAGGATTTLYWFASHDEVTTVTTPWDDVTTPVYNYTSGATRQGTPYVSDSGSDTTTSTDTVTDTPTISGSATGFSRSGTTVTIADRGTSTGAMRSVTYTASNGSATPATVTIYQEANAVVSTVTTPTATLTLVYEGSTFPYEAADYLVDYTSYAETTRTYTSQASETTTEPFTSRATGTNCTPSESTVSGSGRFSIHIAQSGSVQRWVILSLKDPSNNTTLVSINKRQDATPVTPTASIFPDLDTDGRVRFRFVMTAGTFPGSVTVTGITYHWDEATTATPSGDRSVSDITITSDGEAVRLGVINTWFSGDSGVHWFSATGVTGMNISNITFPHEQFEMR